MKTFTSEELKGVLAKHRKWLFNEEGGERADLTGADLSRADLSDAVLTRAVLSRADLSDAVLTGADLTRAVLSRADLSDAVLTGADLTGAVLSRAVLSGADLSRADLSDAVLTGADLSDAVLSGADLTGADLSRADLSDAVLTRAVLSRADLSDADLSRADLTVTVPVIPNIDSAILAVVKQEGCSLDMSNWHTCETTHCRAGWAIHLAGPVGKTIEEIWGSSVAGALIYNASRPGKRVPDFHASNADAMADMKKCAKEEVNQ